MLWCANCDSNSLAVSLGTLSTTNPPKVMVGLILDGIQKQKIQPNHNPIAYQPENMVNERKPYNHLMAPLRGAIGSDNERKVLLKHRLLYTHRHQSDQVSRLRAPYLTR